MRSDIRHRCRRSGTAMKRGTPEHGLSIFATASQSLAVGGKRQSHYFAAVTVEFARLLAARHVPEVNDLIGAAHGQRPAVRRKGQKVQTPSCWLFIGQPADQFSAGDIP